MNLQVAQLPKIACLLSWGEARESHSIYGAAKVVSLLWMKDEEKSDRFCSQSYLNYL